MDTIRAHGSTAQVFGTYHRVISPTSVIWKIMVPHVIEILNDKDRKTKHRMSVMQVKSV